MCTVILFIYSTVIIVWKPCILFKSLKDHVLKPAVLLTFTGKYFYE